MLAALTDLVARGSLVILLAVALLLLVAFIPSPRVPRARRCPAYRPLEVERKASPFGDLPRF